MSLRYFIRLFSVAVLHRFYCTADDLGSLVGHWEQINKSNSFLKKADATFIPQNSRHAFCLNFCNTKTHNNCILSSISIYFESYPQQVHDVVSTSMLRLIELVINVVLSLAVVGNKHKFC